MSLTLLGILSAQAAGVQLIQYWMSLIGGSSQDDQGTGIDIDSSDNVYMVGSTRSAGQGASDFLLVKQNSSGTVQWQRTLGASANDLGYGIAVDSSANAYITGYLDPFPQNLLLAKYNSAGTIQWQRTLGGGGVDYGWQLAIDSNDNIYVSGETRSAGAGSRDVLLAKYNSSGTLQWQRTLGGGSDEYGYGIAVDSSGNVYVAGRTRSAGAGSDDLFLAKYNSSGTIQWQRTVGGSGSDYGNAVGVDSNDNVYITGYSRSTGTGLLELFLAKYNSSGTIQWQRVLEGSGSQTGEGLAFDSSGNVYINGKWSSGGFAYNRFFIVKYDSSGTLQWQRILYGNNQHLADSIKINSSGTVYVSGYMDVVGKDKFFLAALPNDGSLTGFYQMQIPINYIAGSSTSRSISLTAAASSLTAATSSLTAGTSALIDASAALPQDFKEIG